MDAQYLLHLCQLRAKADRLALEAVSDTHRDQHTAIARELDSLIRQKADLSRVVQNPQESTIPTITASSGDSAESAIADNPQGAQS